MFIKKNNILILQYFCLKNTLLLFFLIYMQINNEILYILRLQNPLFRKWNILTKFIRFIGGKMFMFILIARRRKYRRHNRVSKT